MREQLVTLETAKLAQEKGYIRIKDISAYDCQYVHTWERNDDTWGIDEYGEAAEEVIVAPSQSLLQKWLRDEHYIYISINKHCTGSDEWVWSYSIEYLPKDKHNSKRRTVEFKEIKDTYGEFEGGTYGGGEYTYEEALEQALQAGLKLIE